MARQAISDCQNIVELHVGWNIPFRGKSSCFRTTIEMIQPGGLAHLSTRAKGKFLHCCWLRAVTFSYKHRNAHALISDDLKALGIFQRAKCKCQRTEVDLITKASPREDIRNLPMSSNWNQVWFGRTKNEFFDAFASIIKLLIKRA